MTTTIAVSGKGGVGKTTVSALLVKYLKSMKKRNVLVIDADPNSNLHDALGFKLEKTIGDILEEIKEKTEKLEDLPAKMSKSEYISYQLEYIMHEGDGFDFLSMGRPEGPGCYCFINSVLRTAIDLLTKRYEYVIIDNEAGMEHFNRKTTQKVDILLIVSDSTVRGIKTASNMKGLVKTLKLKVKNEYLIVNKLRIEDCGFRIEEKNTKKEITEKTSTLEEEIKKSGLEVLAFLPEDEKIVKYDLEGKPIIEIPEDSKVFKAFKTALDKIGI